ncbi:MAG: ABC-2 family transporter protein [bacterium]|nr:ABC-2 family transporter protein [bacterium]
MNPYISYLKLKIKTGLQYRAAAIAGISTQFFFGMMYVLIYLAFYESNTSSAPMPLKELISYTWLVQAFLSLVYLWTLDKELISSIKDGNIAYELCRPQDLYYMWLSRILGDRVAKVLLRFPLVIIVCALLPFPYKLDLRIGLINLLVFLIALILSTILATVLILLFHIICLYTLDEKGIVNMFMVISEVLSGLTIPIPFFPKYLQHISNILPFRYITDFPFRFYVGNIPLNEGIISIGIQIIWIFVLIKVGRLLLKKALKKVVVQGG